MKFTHNKLKRKPDRFNSCLVTRLTTFDFEPFERILDCRTIVLLSLIELKEPNSLVRRGIARWELYMKVCECVIGKLADTQACLPFVEE